MSSRPAIVRPRRSGRNILLPALKSASAFAPFAKPSSVMFENGHRYTIQWLARRIGAFGCARSGVADRQSVQAHDTINRNRAVSRLDVARRQNCVTSPGVVPPPPPPVLVDGPITSS